MWEYGDGSTETLYANYAQHHYLPGSYSGKVTARNEWDCVAEATFSVEVPRVMFIPNVFTPNGDQKNDFFEFIYNGDVSSYALEIHNRWGGSVFRTTKFEQRWSGGDSPSGIYYYTITIGSTRKQGWVHLIR